MDKTNPDHYKGSTIQPIDLIDSKGLGFYEGNIVKYVSRWKEKDGVADLHKALWYLNRLISLNELSSKNEGEGNKTQDKS